MERRNFLKSLTGVFGLALIPQFLKSKDFAADPISDNGNCNIVLLKDNDNFTASDDCFWDYDPNNGWWYEPVDQSCSGQHMRISPKHNFPYHEDDIITSFDGTKWKRCKT